MDAKQEQWTMAKFDGAGKFCGFVQRDPLTQAEVFAIIHDNWWEHYPSDSYRKQYLTGVPKGTLALGRVLRRVA